MLHDSYNRPIHYLRISVTDACNLRCVYCMPENMTFRPGSALVQDDELIQLIGIFAELGFDKIRFTGGEPTLRTNITGLVRAAARASGVRDVGMTTNAIQLAHLARPLREAGLARVNISIDTLDEKKFRTITRWGNLADVMKGITAAEKAGLKVKLNCVVVRGLNDESDVIALAKLTLEHDWQVRFIEMMPFGGVSDFQLKHSVTEEALRARIAAALGPIEICNDGKLDGEARIYRIAGAPGTLGFISPVTAPFCAGCNRVRLTADGMLRLCLLREMETSLLAPLRAGAPREEIKELIRARVHVKPWGHGLAKKQFATNRTMSEIGG